MPRQVSEASGHRRALVLAAVAVKGLTVKELRAHLDQAGSPVERSLLSKLLRTLRSEGLVFARLVPAERGRIIRWHAQQTNVMVSPTGALVTEAAT